MKLKSLGSAIAVGMFALLTLASSASATTLYTNGIRRVATVTLHATLTGSFVIGPTGGGSGNTCTISTTHGWTTVFTGQRLNWHINTFTYTNCTEEAVVVDQPGELTMETIGAGPNATVRSIGAKITTPSPFGALTCTTASGEGTDIGTITGTTSGTSTLDVNAVVNCGFFLPSAKWEARYIYTGHSIHFTA